MMPRTKVKKENNSCFLSNIICFLKLSTFFLVASLFIFRLGYSMEETSANPIYRCRNCLNPLAYAEDLISKAYKTKSGPGFMFSHAMNVVIGAKAERALITGPYIVADVYCSKCRVDLGWKYVQTFDIKQRFKEGMFVLEKLKMIEEY